MKKYAIIIFLLLNTLALSSQPKQELRAVWLTTLEGLDWPSTKGLLLLWSRNRNRNSVTSLTS